MKSKVVWQRVDDDVLYRVLVVEENGERRLRTEQALHVSLDGEPEWEELDTDRPYDNCEYSSGLPFAFIGWLIDAFRTNPGLKLIVAYANQASDNTIWQVRNGNAILCVGVGPDRFHSMKASHRSLEGKLKWLNCTASNYGDLPQDFQDYVIEMLMIEQIPTSITKFELKD